MGNWSELGNHYVGNAYSNAFNDLVEPVRLFHLYSYSYYINIIYFTVGNLYNNTATRM